jgi:beta-glucosidase
MAGPSQLTTPPRMCQRLWRVGTQGKRVARRWRGSCSGMLPITFPRSVGQLPDFYNHKPSRNRSYMFTSREPLFPFGHGLSYTTFTMANVRVEPAEIAPNANAIVTVEVTNAGNREGDEVPQLYVHQRVSSVTRPVLALRGFQRIHLRPGEKTTVRFTLTPESLTLWNEEMQPVVEPGEFTILVGPSSAQTQATQLKVAAK